MCYFLFIQGIYCFDVLPSWRSTLPHGSISCEANKFSNICCSVGVLAFHLYLRWMNLKRGKVCLGSWVQRYHSVVAWPHCFGPEMALCVTAGGHIGGHLVVPWYQKSKGRHKDDSIDPPKGTHTPMTSFPPTRPHISVVLGPPRTPKLEAMTSSDGDFQVCWVQTVLLKLEGSLCCLCVKPYSHRI